MFFEAVSLKGFRNLPATRFEFGPGINLVLGPNGAGKTNLLEALGMLAGWGPFAGRARNTVAWGQEAAFLKAQVAGEAPHEIRGAITSRMALQADGKRVSCTDLRLILPSLIFLPTDVGLIDGSPAARRSFLDRLCALLYPPYARRLAEFRQVARARALLLRQGKPVGGTALPFAKLGGWVMEARRHVTGHLAALAEGPIPFALAMAPEMGQPAQQCLLAALEATAEREKYALKPLVGPGHDDLLITTSCRPAQRDSCRPASEALSRGQKRRVVLALILAAGRLLERQLRKRPVLLFDDLMAELDAAGRRYALEALGGTGWQVFITGTEDPGGPGSTGQGGRTVLELSP